jgi:hypothetical protein
MRKTTRRNWLNTSLTLAGSSLLNLSDIPSSLLAATPSNPALGQGQFKLGLVTYNIAKDWDIPTLIKNCEETGFEGVELRTTHKHGVEPALSPIQREEVKKQFEGRKVRLLSLGSTCEFHSPDLTVVEKNIEETKRFIELAHDVGALGVKVRPNGIPANVPEEKTLEQIGKALNACGQAAKDQEVEIWLEVHGRDSCLPRRIRRMMEAADHTQVGICWNSNPEDIENGTIKGNFQLLVPWLRNCHITELWNEQYPWRELFKLLKSNKYQRFTLAELPESAEPLRLMRYYRALWLALQPSSI